MGRDSREVMESKGEHSGSDDFCLLQGMLSQFSILASYDSHFALPALLMGISKYQRNDEKKAFSLPGQNISYRQNNSRKSHRKV